MQSLPQYGRPGAAISILYRGPLSSCNYACGYCPFAKRRETREELAADARALGRFVDWVGRQGGGAARCKCRGEEGEGLGEETGDETGHLILLTEAKLWPPGEYIGVILTSA